MGTRILAVEDDERIRSAVKLALEDEGWTVDGVESGEAAIEVFETAADDADSRKVRKFAKAQLPHLHQHLDAARVIQGVVGEPEPVA